MGENVDEELTSRHEPVPNLDRKFKLGSFEFDSCIIAESFRAREAYLTVTDPLESQTSCFVSQNALVQMSQLLHVDGWSR
jgi:hypothetical protein